MGWLHYESMMFSTEDRTLAHLEVALLQKLRRGECFFFRWRIAPENGSGRVALWCSPGIALRFRFGSAEPVEINKTWVEELIASSYSDGGMELSDEPFPPTRDAAAR